MFFFFTYCTLTSPLKKTFTLYYLSFLCPFAGFSFVPLSTWCPCFSHVIICETFQNLFRKLEEFSKLAKIADLLQ